MISKLQVNEKQKAIKAPFLAWSRKKTEIFVDSWQIMS